MIVYPKVKYCITLKVLIYNKNQENYLLIRFKNGIFVL